MERKEMIKEKIMFFKENKKKVHIKLGKFFYNGTIAEIQDTTFYILDRKIGKKLIFFNEVEAVDEYDDKDKTIDDSESL